CGFVGGCHFGDGGGLDINTDVAGLFEIKWIYTEFDLTRKDSPMPVIPGLTGARAGGGTVRPIPNQQIHLANRRLRAHGTRRPTRITRPAGGGARASSRPRRKPGARPRAEPTGERPPP